jgi:NAD(P)-dependent dehydrogenase (short-subunit alcohol dehydrogenase family)
MATTQEITNTFGATSTTEDILAGINLTEKQILVTGVSAGLGVETARSLAAHGAKIVGATGAFPGKDLANYANLTIIPNKIEHCRQHDSAKRRGEEIEARDYCIAKQKGEA